MEGTEFELIVEAKPAEVSNKELFSLFCMRPYYQWTYLGRYRSLFLPGGEMQLSEWLVLDDEVSFLPYDEYPPLLTPSL